ncbi:MULTISPECIES: type II toxin-antitoxin system RelE/ParE family toxin [unclassified Neisseria]|uniref:type II toxin-antitoxin system RelE/ParE family toxin n=1 Tax=unclassified Neisseria TaxID=2623750 RepID=UPI002665CC04|nr:MULTISPECIES: type II toxin-antitoxin system RelE/ParE family toxin [unclassified Neisseria]MDO1509531.1 type II toxin-antitoxin system RelE/ParE family toxin [Neisseria sp. MVDL19-042950]MDO1515697.1 type II toxin-antitoxin system RelE/ParE family toxin [Neisseria sp. MVDL18-041461]MDO1563479.1 type II toxin-antitoxin system RelE/ParE family toxin [Neisseria sp. MVDL20-010259]
MHIIEWSAGALSDVDDILDFMFADNPHAAVEMDLLIHDSVQHLSTLPYIGRKGRVADTREYVIHPNYLIIYEVSPSRVKILSVLHVRKEYP